MFTLHKIQNNGTRQALNYALEVSQSQDYFCEKEKVVGQWQGKLIDHLGIDSVQITREAIEYMKLFNNINPSTNQKLTQRETDIRIYDFQCSAPKSVSIMATIGEDERIIDAHNRAVKNTLSEMENYAERRERSEKNYNTEAVIETKSLLIAKFTHLSSRALDPQLHTHCQIFNCTYDENKKEYYALQNESIYKNLEYFGRFYQNELSRELQSIGYKTRTVETSKGEVKGFELSGISDDMIRKFSKRSIAIEQELQAYCEEKSKSRSEVTKKEIDIISRRTRNAKLYNLSNEQLKTFQSKQLNQNEISELKDVLNKAITELTTFKENDIQQQISKALRHLTERNSVFTQEQLKTEVLKNSCGQIKTNQLNESIKLNQDIVFLDKGKLTTREVFHEEQKTISIINSGIGSHKAFNESYIPFSEPIYIRNEMEKGYDYSEQRLAVKGILNNKDTFQIFRGLAGTGKTTALLEVEKGLTQAGHNTFYFTPSADAVNKLKEEGFANAKTVANLLEKIKHNQANEYANSVIVIDEAGLISSKQGKALVEFAEKSKCRVILSGDSKQHISVERGEFLRMLEDYSKINTTELKNIRRQKDEYLRNAIIELSKNNTREGLALLNSPENGKSYITETEAYIKEAAEQYFIYTDQGKDIKNTLAIAPTNKEVDELSKEIRKRVKERGLLTADVDLKCFKSFDWTNEQKKDFRKYKEGYVVSFNQNSGENKKNTSLQVREVKDSFIILEDGSKFFPEKSAQKVDVGNLHNIKIAPGDRIRILSNDKNIGVTNGDILTVKSIDESGKIITANGKVITSDFKRFSYGYVDTSHKSQGKSIANVVIACRKMDSKAAYVAPSRTIGNLKIFTPDKELLFRSTGMNVNEIAHDLKNRPEYIDGNTQKSIFGITASSYQGISKYQKWARKIYRLQFLQSITKSIRNSIGIKKSLEQEKAKSIFIRQISNPSELSKRQNMEATKVNEHKTAKEKGISYGL
ncbi:MAG: MobF family relaxase [Lentisphaerota bacterium]